MKVLNISLDKKLFDAESGVRKRVFEYAEIFDRFDILVLSRRQSPASWRAQAIGGQARRGYEKIEQDPRSAEGFGGASKINIWPTNSRSKLFYLLDAYGLGAQMIERYKYDLISVQDPFEMGIVGWLLAKKYNIKLQVQLHGDFFGSPYFRQESLTNKLRYYLGKFIIKRADGIRTVSERIKKSLVEMGIEERKISVVPICVEISDKRPEISKKADGRFVFVTVGRLEEVKNIGMQIEAMAEVVKKHPEAELWIVGEGNERKKLKLKIENCKLQNYIKLFGWQTDLERYYQTADAFLLTSNHEGWGMAVIEAASYGLPIIMTDVGCAGEVIKNGTSGLVIPVGDREKLEIKMIDLIENKEIREFLANGAREAVVSLPGKEKSLEMYKEACEKI